MFALLGWLVSWFVGRSILGRCSLRFLWCGASWLRPSVRGVRPSWGGEGAGCRWWFDLCKYTNIFRHSEPRPPVFCSWCVVVGRVVSSVVAVGRGCVSSSLLLHRSPDAWPMLPRCAAWVRFLPSVDQSRPGFLGCGLGAFPSYC